jgi:hypothetical protein
MARRTNLYRRQSGRWTAYLRVNGEQLQKTLGVYSHVLPDALDEAGDAMEAVLFGSGAAAAGQRC